MNQHKQATDSFVSWSETPEGLTNTSAINRFNNMLRTTPDIEVLVRLASTWLEYVYTHGYKAGQADLLRSMNARTKLGGAGNQPRIH